MKLFYINDKVQKNKYEDKLLNKLVGQRESNKTTSQKIYSFFNKNRIRFQISFSTLKENAQGMFTFYREKITGGPKETPLEILFPETDSYEQFEFFNANTNPKDIKGIAKAYLNLEQTCFKEAILWSKLGKEGKDGYIAKMRDAEMYSRDKFVNAQKK